jgi:ankyrin repeat protein
MLFMTADRFRWVYCQLDNLRRCMPSSIRKSLNELPITLDETYERTLQGIPKQKWQHAHRLFQCLVAAIRPLRVEELAEIFTIEFGSNVAHSLVESWRPEDPEEAVLSACSTLISIIDDEGSKIVQFSHFSVKEFLTSDRLQTTDVENVRQYHIPLEPAHTLLAQACLTVLLQLDENVDKERVETFALAFYAAEHLVDHAKFQNVESQIQDTLEHLFNPMKPHFRAWIWMHNMDPSSSSSSLKFDRYPSPPPPDFTSLYYAALCGFSGLAKRLIIAHAEDANAKCCAHSTPLYAASLGGHVDVARVLFDHGADVNAQKDGGFVPLHAASLRGHRKVVQFLLEHEATVDARDYIERTPLYSASECGHLEVVRLLLEHEATVDARDRYEQTPLYSESEYGHFEVVRLLLEHEATVDARDCYERTPLYPASMYGHLEVVRLLLDHGADANIQGSSGTPLQMATTNGHHEIARLLPDHGAQSECSESTEQ